MNIVDLIILLVVGISVIYAVYHGFVQTVANIVGLLVSLGAAFIFGPRLADVFIANKALTGLLWTQAGGCLYRQQSADRLAVHLYGCCVPCGRFRFSLLIGCRHQPQHDRYNTEERGFARAPG